jgi:hypothetical protein
VIGHCFVTPSNTARGGIIYSIMKFIATRFGTLPERKVLRAK